jgi:hypothetical protein
MLLQAVHSIAVLLHKAQLVLQDSQLLFFAAFLK